MVGVRVQSILDQFWRDDHTPDALQAMEMEGWIDVLEECSHIEIRSAWTVYQNGGPRTSSGRLAKPLAGDLWRIIRVMRGSQLFTNDPEWLCKLALHPKKDPEDGDERQLSDGSWETYHSYSGWVKLHV